MICSCFSFRYMHAFLNMEVGGFSSLPLCNLHSVICEQDTTVDVGRDGRNVSTAFETKWFYLCFRSFRMLYKGLWGWKPQNILQGSETKYIFLTCCIAGSLSGMKSYPSCSALASCSKMHLQFFILNGISLWHLSYSSFEFLLYLKKKNLLNFLKIYL